MRTSKPTFEKLHIEAVAGLRPIRVEIEEFTHPFHFHREVELLYVEASKGTVLVGDRIDSFQPHQLYMFGSNLPHLFRNDRPLKGRVKAEIIQFPISTLQPFLEATGEFTEVVRLLNRSLQGLRFAGESAFWSRGMMKRVRGEQGPRRWILFLEMLDVLSREEGVEELNSRTLDGPQRAPYPEHIRKSCEAILSGFADDLSHTGIAAAAGMSPSAFSRSFRQYTGRTFTDFVNEVRLGHAARLLIETRKRITDIAYASGYSNIAHFNRQFRRLYRCTPRDYRNR